MNDITESATDRESMFYARGYFDCLFDLGIVGQEALTLVREAIRAGHTLPILKRGLDTAGLERLERMPAPSGSVN